MRKKGGYCFLALLFIIFCGDRLASAYTVDGYWTSEEGWGEPATEFTTYNEAVYINVLTHTDPVGVGLSFRWYKPSGEREYDVGTNLLAHRVFDDKDLLIGFWTYMVIKGMNREPGQWRVEHWAYGSRGGVLDWYLMFAAYFTITLEVAPPTFSPEPGIYTGPQKIELSCLTPSSIIHYTADGSEPTEISMLYSTPIDVEVTTTIKARAYRNGWAPSETSTATYTINKGIPWIPLLLDE